MKSPESLNLKLNERKNDNSFRKLVEQGNRIDFFSNDYLGLAKIQTDSNLSHGSTGSRLISGNSKEIEQLEEDLAQFFDQESALIFNSGYDANLGFYSCVPQRNDIVLYDELCHASIRDGIRLGLAKSYSFRHNDTEHLRELLNKHQGAIYVAIESVYSMDGDESPLNKMADLCTKKKAYLIVDEAHSAGVYGEKGEGLVSKYDLNEKVFAKLVTFGKAYGSHGSAILSNSIIKEYLINFSRPFIYSTALSPITINRIQMILEISKERNEERNLLFENIKVFREKMNSRDLISSDSPIQSLLIPNNNSAILLAQKCLDSGFAVKAILAPTVPAGKERIRISLHSFNTQEEIHKLVQCLK